MKRASPQMNRASLPSLFPEDAVGRGEILREEEAEDETAAEAEQGLRAVEDDIDPRILLN
jgi:hypothetical protein